MKLSREKLHFLLVMIILATVPFYCLGILAYLFAIGAI